MEATACFLNLRRPCSDLRREGPSSSRIALFLDLRRLSGMLQRRRCAGPPLEMLGVARRSIPRSVALTIRSLYLKRPTTGVLCLRAADNVEEDEDERIPFLQQYLYYQTLHQYLQRLKQQPQKQLVEPNFIDEEVWTFAYDLVDAISLENGDFLIFSLTCRLRSSTDCSSSNYESGVPPRDFTIAI
ncbi:hypothetical protein LXL04_030157 [Taraxacum kok-saghyz]